MKRLLAILYFPLAFLFVAAQAVSVIGLFWLLPGYNMGKAAGRDFINITNWFGTISIFALLVVGKPIAE